MRGGGSQIARLTVRIWGIAIAVVIAAMSAPAIAAEDELRIAGRFGPAPPPEASDAYPSGSLILNAPARTAFQPFLMPGGKTLVRIIDLDTLKTTGSVEVPGNAVANRSLSFEFVNTIDIERNFLYLAYQGQDATDPLTFSGIAVIDGNKRRLYRLLDRTDSISPTDSIGCTAPSCLPQIQGAQPVLHGLDFVPAYVAGGRPKLLLLLEDQSFIQLNQNSAIVWAMEWDPETGRQNWIYQVRACQNRQMPVTPFSRYSLPIFHARYGTGVYLGCQASGGTGQAVRLILGSDGRPTSEAAYPGPSDVSDVLVDTEGDRLIFRVVNGEGESAWVFDAASNSYTGVVGLTKSQAPTSLGIDVQNGRLYLLAPPTASGSQRSAGGLMLSDIRRSPAPQALSFPEFAGNGAYRIGVDSVPKDGARRFFIRRDEDPYFTIIEDRVPLSQDPPVSDVDRLTKDVDEKPGETGVNFTGTGHAWGVRASFIGGLEGTPTGGPDISGIRLGRFVPKWLGSPCGPQDRRITIGDIRSAGLSNNLANAAATAGAPDPGTGTDIGEATSRCYPHPRPNNFDPLGLAFGDTPPKPHDTDTDQDGVSDLDEWTGSDWPFGVAECGGDSEGSSSTSTKPLDRGSDTGLPDEVRDTQLVPKDVDDAARLEPLPEDLRDETLPLEGYGAQVSCKQTKGAVVATAEARNFEDSSVEELGPVSAANVHTRVDLFRDSSGLVSRSTAIVRGISIANKIFIEAAISVAEARAAGRPGTAETTFYRKLCGVRIPDLNIEADEVDLDVPGQNTPAGYLDPVDEDTDDVNIKEIDADVCGEPGQSALGRQPMIDAMNAVLGSRGRVSAPDPDGELRQGTPGGYLASIQKDRLEQISARSVNNDESTQVPGLQILIFNDDPTEGRGRQIYQFAGVDASVTYGIYLLNPGDTFEDIPDLLIDITGGVPFTPPTGPPPVGNGPQQGPPPRQGPLTIIFQGIGFLFRSPADALLAAAVWMLLFSPVQLSTRRRALRGLA